MPTNQ